ncbi:MAG: hypothetical protein KDC38_10105 [Planctomycetes bacterium]|nr:hypothetical protein [Planctomycetota bacterium]
MSSSSSSVISEADTGFRWIHRTLPAAAAVFAVSVAVRWPFATGLPDTPDGVRLIRALHCFDLLEFSPQFPGYPLSVAFARLLPFEGGLAWGAANIVATSLAAALLVPILARTHGLIAATIAAWVSASLPAFVLESLRVGTDGLVLPWLLAGLSIASRPRGSFLGGLLVGLGLGFRPSAAVWCAGLLLAPHRRRAGGGLALGVLAWLLPTCAVVGFESYCAEGWRFTIAHFTQWGGTALSSTSGGPSRWAHAWEHWLVVPLGLTALAVPVGAVAFFRRRTVHGPLFVGAVVDLAWILVAQNPEHFRHFMPLAWLAIAFAIAATIARASEHGVSRVGTVALASTLGLACAWWSVDVGARYRESRPPVMSAMAELERDSGFDPLVDRVYVSSERAYFTWKHPDWSIGTARTLEEVDDDVAGLPVLPRRIWICDSIAGAPGSPTIRFSRPARLAPWGHSVSFHPRDVARDERVGLR